MFVVGFPLLDFLVVGLLCISFITSQIEYHFIGITVVLISSLWLACLDPFGFGLLAICLWSHRCLFYIFSINPLLAVGLQIFFSPLLILWCLFLYRNFTIWYNQNDHSYLLLLLLLASFLKTSPTLRNMTTLWF